MSLYVRHNGAIVPGFALGDATPLQAALKEVLAAARRFSRSLSAREEVVCGICLSATHLEEAIVAGDFLRAEAHADKIVKLLEVAATRT